MNIWQLQSEAKQKHQAGDYGGAVEGYRAILESPDGMDFVTQEALLHQAIALRALNRLDEEYESLKKLFKHFEGSTPPAHYSVNMYFFFACHYFAKGDIETGRKVTTALNKYLFNPDMLKDFNPECLNPRDMELAIEDCTKGSSWLARGLAYRALGQWDAALADIERACEEDPANATPWLHATRVLRNGYPNRYNQASLLPGYRYISMEFSQDDGITYITTYALEATQRTIKVSLPEGGHLYQVYQGEGWQLLRKQNHKEGMSVTFFRRDG